MAMGQDPINSPYIEKIRKVVDFTFSHQGYRSDGALYYTGTYNNGSISITDSQLQWWPQGEGLSAVCLMQKLYPDDPFYSDTLNLSWSFINSDVIDHTYRGWVNQAGQMNGPKASEWHANYHSGRALMNCLTWLSDDTVPTYTLTVSTAGAGLGSVDLDPAPPAGGYTEGTVVTLTATAGAASAFTEWSGDLTGAVNPTTITMDGDRSVTATFATVPTYTLTVSTAGAGSGSVDLDPAPPAGGYTEGTVVTLTATAGAASAFTEWSGDLTGAVNPTTITMDGNKTVTATFDTVPTYTLTVSTAGAGSGSVDLDPAPPAGGYNAGTVVTLTATADAGSEFSAWSGDLTSAVNPTTITMDGDRSVTATFEESTSAYFEDFGETAGVDPAGWLDTGANNSLAENDSLFATMAVDGGIAFGTSSTATNIHSHYTAASYDAGVGIVLTGRMRMSATTSGIGVTFLSDYPNSDTYYRLRRYSGTAFHIDPHGTTVSGDIDSGVVPAADTWYLYKIEVVDTGSRTEIRANIWPEGSAEPTGWQIDAWDDGGSRRASGRIGVWSMDSGSKYWDDLAVETLAPVNQQPVAVGAADPSSGVYPLEVELDGSASYDPDGSIVLYEWDFTGDSVYDWSGSDATSGITTFSYGASGTYNAVLRVTDNESATGTTSVTVTVSEPDQPASIVSHPADQSVTEGQAATFTVAAAGTAPINYQWQFWNNTDWVDIIGATSSSYTLDEALFPR